VRRYANRVLCDSGRGSFEERQAGPETVLREPHHRGKAPPAQAKTRIQILEGASQRGGGHGETETFRIRKSSAEQGAKQAVAERPSIGFFDLGPRPIDEMHVVNAGWAGGHAGEAGKTAIILNEVSLTSFSSSRSVGFYPPFRIALNRGRRRRQKFVEPLLDHNVAFTRCFLQAGTIDDLYLPPMVADETGGLHRLRGKRHRFPVGPQHVSQKFVRVRPLCGIRRDHAS
jgi:hypothetical protein